MYYALIQNETMYYWNEYIEANSRRKTPQFINESKNEIELGYLAGVIDSFHHRIILFVNQIMIVVYAIYEFHLIHVDLNLNQKLLN